jgi:hypothetical protein
MNWHLWDLVEYSHLKRQFRDQIGCAKMLATSPRRRPGSTVLQVFDSMDGVSPVLNALGRLCCGAMDPGLPHGTSPWAEGPRDDDHASACAQFDYARFSPA